MSVWWRHNLSLERKSQTCAFVFEHRSKLTHALLQTGELYCGCLAHFLGIFVSGKGGIRLMRRKPYYLYLSSSELGEYPTYIIRLSGRFLWEMHHKSTVLEILSELSEDPT